MSLNSGARPQIWYEAGSLLFIKSVRILAGD
jgi:hypothetical protein